MRGLRMHAAVAEQAHQVQCAVASTSQRRLQRRTVTEASGPDHLVDARDVHLHNAARTNVEVADLTVTHLSVRQADVRPVSADERMRESPPETVEGGRTGHRYGVVCRVRVVAPAVRDGQYEWFGYAHSVPFRRLCPSDECPSRDRGMAARIAARRYRWQQVGARRPLPPSQSSVPPHDRRWRASWPTAAPRAFPPWAAPSGDESGWSFRRGRRPGRRIHPARD